MNKEQKKEWDVAQKISVSVDLVEAAKKHLKFLAAIDRNRYLYEGPGLQWAIYRYNAFWLPLLAKHLENPVSEDPLVVPLDCEWIWHCHRLNPVKYKSDCRMLYGRILRNHKITCSVEPTSKNTTEDTWNKMYPDEPYELDITRPFPGDFIQKGIPNKQFTSYDLVSAVKRQIQFTYQVSRPHMSDDLYLQEAVARYKAFLHLIRKNRKTGIKRFCVPTYDIDLIWHTHQLHPDSYCKDLIKTMGKVLEHDETDSTRKKGNKLDAGYYETTRQWEDTYGKRYWKAGSMYRGNAPTPVTQIPLDFNHVSHDINETESSDKSLLFPSGKALEVLMEFVEIKDLPESHKGNLCVTFCKKQFDKLFNTKRSLGILSESGEKQVANFLCEPTGDFLFELNYKSTFTKMIPRSSRLLGYCSLSLQELLASQSQLSFDKFLSVDLASGLQISTPILLHVSISFTFTSQAPQVFHLEQPTSFCKKYCFARKCCFLPFLKRNKVKHSATLTNVTANDGKHVCSLQMRNKVKNANRSTPELLKEVHYTTACGKKYKVGKFLGDYWLVKGTHGFLKLQSNSGPENHLFELSGYKTVKLFAGRRLEFERRHCRNRRCEQKFITAVEFSADCPYGNAIALFDLEFGTIKALDELIVLPSIVLSFILSDVLESECARIHGVNSCGCGRCDTIKSDVCTGGKCGGSCGNMVKSGGCGGNCGGAGICGGSCGSVVKSSGCGGGGGKYSGSCGSMIK